MCLFHILVQLAQEWDLTLHAVHVNHQLRGIAADGDQAYAEELCAAFEVPCHVFACDVATLAKAWGMTTEEAGRKVRYQAFDEVRHEILTRRKGDTALDNAAKGVKIAVAQNLNFSKAAESVALTQPAVSHQIRSLEEEIIEFADLGEYIDQPLRTYSSGMKARLGFAINANIKPEILIVDEALSVGDKEFRRKCNMKINEIVAGGEVTFLFVTHSTNVAKSFCKRGIVMRAGKITYDGDIGDAIDFYENFLEEVRKNNVNKKVLG